MRRTHEEKVALVEKYQTARGAGKTPEEAAEMLGMTVSAISQVRSALKKDGHEIKVNAVVTPPKPKRKYQRLAVQPFVDDTPRDAPKVFELKASPSQLAEFISEMSKKFGGR
jgi:hypothetical protein